MQNAVQHVRRKKRRDQSYRVFLIKYLSGFISANNCKCLLLGSDDPEVLSTYSPFDQYHVTLKARHVVDALEAMYSATTNEIPITWMKACEIACKRKYNMVARPRTIADWYLDLHSTRDKLQFNRSKRGRSSYFAISPFSEDECLTV